MTFTVDQLLLKPDKAQRLATALASLGVSDPLGTCIEEAVADVQRYCSGYDIDDAAKMGWVRTLALFKAYSLAESVPADVKAAHDLAIKELAAIAAGERPNLDPDGADRISWGSEEHIS
jgi:hypothetical protein